MRFVIATHGHCFDGLASAVLFTRLIRSLEGPLPAMEYRACGYGVSQLRADDGVLTGEQNAILDYRFWPSAKLSWYFDHHKTAFQSTEHRELYEARRDSGRFFFDAGYSSCTKLIADVARDRFGLHEPLLDPLVEWADLIDAARFESAEQAVSREKPVMRLVSVIEHFGDDNFLSHYVPLLLERPLAEVAAAREITDRYRPLGEKQQRFVTRVREKAERLGRVVFVDLTDAVAESVGKFVTYALFPESTYSVIVGLLKSGVKISVGYNPWSGKPLDQDISQICARFGGGGHPVVGGISFSHKEMDRARAVAREIARELAG
jgi:hypothetical protein